MKTDFRRYARELADGEQASGLLPVIEKEIIHYEILCSLSNRGYLTMITFQGGTSLRLCHGSPRYSEDLDFAAGNAFDDLDPEQIAADLQNDLLDGFDVSVRVRPPKASPVDGEVGVKKWLTIVDMAPARPDLPSQKIKLEVDSVPAYTREAMRLRTNYPGLPDSYASVYIPCQSLGEILADKLVSFANAEHVRYRDLWDIPWLIDRLGPLGPETLGFLERKHGDYGCEEGLASLMERGAARAREAYSDGRFAEQMLRFLTPDAYARTVGSEPFFADMRERTASAFALTARTFGGKPGTKSETDEAITSRDELHEQEMSTYQGIVQGIEEFSAGDFIDADEADRQIRAEKGW